MCGGGGSCEWGGSVATKCVSGVCMCESGMCVCLRVCVRACLMFVMSNSQSIHSRTKGEQHVLNHLLALHTSILFFSVAWNSKENHCIFPKYITVNALLLHEKEK